MRPYVEKRIWPISYCQKSQRKLIALKLKLNVSCHQLDLYTRLQLHISKHMEKGPENFPWACTKCGTLTFVAINEEKWLWHIFGCKVGQSDPIVMKLNVCCCLLDAFTKFQIDISNIYKQEPPFRVQTSPVQGVKNCIIKMCESDPCLMSEVYWKFHDDPCNHFSVMLVKHAPHPPPPPPPLK